ncbi:hypothetical protein [Pusillimonas sp.]|uniref:hypothetical protein n=1 Tax=Pusillimonas sp. TaxID=3040095 RepID=UPI0037C61491
MQDFSRGMGKPHEPLFAPLLFGVAAQIESISPDEMALDGTRIRKNVGELRGALGGNTVFSCAPSVETFAGLSPFGGDDHGSFLSQPRFEASLDAVRQWQADSSEPVIVAAFFGPHRHLLSVSEQQGAPNDTASWYEHIGANLAALVRHFAEAGVHVLQWYDTMPDTEADIQEWKGALGTMGNIARFHRVAPLLILDNPSVPAWPAQAIACPDSAQMPAASPRPCGQAWPVDPEQWGRLSEAHASSRLITTKAEVAADTSIDSLLSAGSRL